MHIYSKQTGPVSLDTPKAVRNTDPKDGTPVSSVPAVTTSTDRSDKVHISDAGRALAARKDDGAKAASSGLDPARAERIRGRILSGAYDTLEVVDAVARRLLDSGDL